MEISQESIINTSVENKTKLADDIMRLLNVREKNSEMSKDWLLFLSTSNFKITPGEIYLAFQMAISREILDTNGNEINLLPELSNNMTGKVIYSYLEYKKNSLPYHNAKDKLKSLKTQEKEITEIDKQNIRNEFLKTVFDDISESGFCDMAHLLYDELIFKLKINPTADEKRGLYAKELSIHIPIEKENLRNKNPHGFALLIKKFELEINSKEPITYVQNRCKSLLSSEYLKLHITDFETFKKAIN